MTTHSDHAITLNELSPFYGQRRAVLPVSMRIEGRQITAVIGPSGCGKSTLLRCLNRMHETVPGARATGSVLLDGEDIYAPAVDARLVRRKIGMVFQQPVALRTRSIFDNVAVGLQLAGLTNRAILAEQVERSLRAAALWDEVKDKLDQSGLALSGGQQQRLSIARVLAVEPEVILLDEPCAALDPVATFKIEELLLGLRQHYTLVIVTHNLQQAGRIADRTAFFYVDPDERQLVGRLVEYAPTKALFANPSDQRTVDYIAGRFG